MTIRRAEPLLERNTLRLPGRAAALATVSGVDELRGALDWARAQGMPVVPLGEGSNIVLAGDLEALVLCQSDREITPLEQSDHTVLLRVDAGCHWHSLVQHCLQRGWYGLENLALIPGLAGAAPIQNIGAYGVEIERFVRAVHGVYCDSGKAFSLGHTDCEFGYRDSIFKGELRDRVVITGIDLALSREPCCELSYPALREALQNAGVKDASPHEVFDAVVAVRRRKLPDPSLQPNAGSFFKNPVVPPAQAAALAAAHPSLPQYPQPDGSTKLPAAWLIDQCGWKGCREGRVGVHPQHALVLVNYGNGTGTELLALARQVAASVQQAFGIALEMEPRVYGGNLGGV